ncbi:MAG: hypothetical protein SFU53_12565 [Terrimicrobiaceae bacterium]|nr:hypothetical protein [Terrimicrobiaceae bacterium]
MPRFTGELGQREEIFRAARMCVPPLDRLGELTFGDRPADEVGEWAKAVFGRYLMPSLLEARDAVVNGGPRELAAIDQALDRALAGPLAGRSREAGRRVLLESSFPPGERRLARYAADVLGGEGGGHLCTVLGVRSAVFHFPPQVALGALVFLEMRSFPTNEVWNAVATALNGVPWPGSGLRAA